MCPEKFPHLVSNGDGDDVFVRWHIFTRAGSPQKSLKQILAFIWNNDRNYFYAVLKQIEISFQLKYLGRQFSLYEDVIIFADKQTQEPLVFKASKVSGTSLQDITAAKISLMLETPADIRLIISHGLLPARLQDLLVKYL